MAPVSTRREGIDNDDDDLCILLQSDGPAVIVSNRRHVQGNTYRTLVSVNCKCRTVVL